MSEARKRGVKNTKPEILNKIYKKIAKTKKDNGDILGEKNPRYRKKRLDLSKRNELSWKDINYCKKMRNILSTSFYKGSKKQKELYPFLCKNLGENNVKYNDWGFLDYKYESDILLIKPKFVVEWEGIPSAL